MFKKLITAIVAAFVLSIAAHAQTTCAAPVQAGPNFSGSYTIAAGTTLPVVWTPSTTTGCKTYYTLDGSTPSSTSPVYTGQTLNLSKTTTILMVAEGTGFTSSAQVGGGWTITVTGTVPPSVTLSCTPSTASTTNNPGTVTLLRSPAFSSPVTGLAPNCAYTDTAVTNGTTYNYNAEFVQNGETSGLSNTYTAIIPPLVALTTPTVSVVASATSPVSNTAVEVTVSVTGSGAIPTGSIVLTGAGYTSASATLVNGTVVITIPINSLTTGASNFVATYTPDSSSASVYNTATGSEAVIVIPAAPSTLSGTVTN